MDIVFADTFGKSLKRMIARQRWYWVIFDLFRYDIPRFIKNVWDFRKELWYNYDFDARGSLSLLKRSLERTADVLEFKGHEVEEPRLKKVAKIRRAIEILGYHYDDDFIELAEKQLEKKVTTNFEFSDVNGSGFCEMLFNETEKEAADNREIFDLAYKLEYDTWKELFSILEGQDRQEFEAFKKTLTEDELKKEDSWYNWYDGSGLLGWWD